MRLFFNEGLRQMYEHLPHVDAVIEVHDARVSFKKKKKNPFENEFRNIFLT